MTRVIVAVGDKKYAEDFMVALLPQGLEVYIIEEVDALGTFIQERPPHILVFDSDSDLFGGLDALEKLQAEGRLSGVQVVLFSKESGLDFVKRTMTMGVVGYLYKPITPNEIKQKMNGLIHEIRSEKNRREYVRVKTTRLEKSKIEVVLHDGTGVSGRVSDISIGGVAFTLSNPQMIQRLVSGEQYNNVRLMLEGCPDVVLSAEAVLAKGDRAAFKFVGFDGSSLKVLCRYIHGKLLSVGNGDQQTEALAETV